MVRSSCRTGFMSPVWRSYGCRRPVTGMTSIRTSASPPCMHIASAGQRKSPVTPSKCRLIAASDRLTVWPGASVTSRETGDGVEGLFPEHAVTIKRQIRTNEPRMYAIIAELVPDDRNHPRRPGRSKKRGWHLCGEGASPFCSSAAHKEKGGWHLSGEGATLLCYLARPLGRDERLVKLKKQVRS